MKCSRCGRELSEDRAYVHQDRVLCEDCLMDIGLSVKDCDPWATYIDRRSRVQPGMKHSQSLSESERRIYELVRSRGRVTREEVMASLGLSEADLKAQLVPLLHADLIKELGQGERMFLVPVGDEAAS